MVVADPNLISPTALFVAYMRSFSDIPYAVEIASLCNAEDMMKELAGPDFAKLNCFAPMLELRFKCVSEAIERYGVRDTEGLIHVMELASGMSSRSLIRTETERGIFLETDLSPILTRKIEINCKLLDYARRPLMRRLPVNVLEQGGFEMARHIFEDRPVTVVNEGLIPYLSREERAVMANNIHAFLWAHGGVWITPDISSQDSVKKMAGLDPSVLEIVKRVSQLTQRDLDANRFSSDDEARRLYEDAGFEVEVVPAVSLVGPLSSVTRAGVSLDQINPLLNMMNVWIMRPKGK